MGTQLSHEEMRAVLAKGQNVIYGGQVINHPSQLPSPVDLALGNVNAEGVAAEDIDAKIAQLQAEKKKIVEAQAARAEADKKANEEAAAAEKEAAKQEKEAAKEK